MPDSYPDYDRNWIVAANSVDSSIGSGNAFSVIVMYASPPTVKVVSFAWLR